MAFQPAGPEAKARATARRREDRAARAADITARLWEAYRTHPDREYAEAFYGDMLRERGVLS